MAHRDAWLCHPDGQSHARSPQTGCSSRSWSCCYNLPMLRGWVYGGVGGVLPAEGPDLCEHVVVSPGWASHARGNEVAAPGAGAGRCPNGAHRRGGDAVRQQRVGAQLVQGRR
ncbi:hypothetical protein NDU88_005660 [Pleurodeles waltl]|uniref:Uncharacterized protein n=1 Tax=Pleurodeles waltl TaxID=8319 RepID=A0AAV7NR78_PLEWA|nr:hypothetical protein NDU88_005660 [Pleurodeles waltl]